MAEMTGTAALTLAEWETFLDRVEQPLNVQRRDRFWYEGELIDRSFAFLFQDGRLVSATETFATTTGAPPRPFADPAPAWERIAAGAGDLARAVDAGRITAPKLTFQFQFWLMPDVVAYEVNYLANDAEELFAGKPVLPAEPSRWERVAHLLREGSVRFDGMEGQFQRARYLQTYFAFRFVDGELREVREMGFGALPDRVYGEAAQVWRDLGSGQFNPLRDVERGRFGPNLVATFRVLKHGPVGHLGIFLRPLQRLGVR
ncbi:MAG: hypothetical protein RMM58_06115 [Chloroflexota bacterium]|nr:hypothetical protein [Dehalococcoidia bacterium]MDW8253436.1 hypothetical protein [Chloroflexota bacterium]